ncbi:MAG: Asp-tRNA(Asn)/Glu-tRNA(Gln) amidotransferase subunit GatB [Cyclobacteriaceae bacterium]|nr:Asp-tRNA(Asn)/Glu-tRNA(Gln) amidotransferase subunit GatB [Cyclobacteriaceae bacterium]
MSYPDKYEVVIGLEVHAQLSTESKLFCGDSTAYGAEPNHNISVITLAHPGTLPKLNEKALELAAKMGIACHCEISREMFFDRKNYFYPDLPKGYQITQDRTPICKGGYVPVKLENGEIHHIQLTKIHLEEDAGKSIHTEDAKDSLIDYNRAGMPLIEIVTEPVIHSSAEAARFLYEVRRLVRYLGVSDGNMEEGSFRCDANISLRLKGQKELGCKVEIKNLNSFKNVQRAIDFEIGRQSSMLDNQKEIIQETRNFDPQTGKTSGMRKKETLTDYRYFPDPDLSPVHLSEEWLNTIKADIEHIPWDMERELVEKYGLPEYDAGVICEDRQMTLYFSEVVNHTDNFKAVSNWIMGPVKGYLNDNKREITEFPLSAEKLAGLVRLVDDGGLSFSAASKHLFGPLVLNPEKDVKLLAEELDLIHDHDTLALEQIVSDVLSSHPKEAEQLRNGKKKLVGMFMGELMKRTKGKLNPKEAKELLMKELS